MEPTRFDCWTRGLALSDRRQVVAALLAVPMAALPSRTRADATCQPNRKRGDACQEDCQCHGDYRCGKPRTTGLERHECGQHLSADKVCCLGRGDSCGNNDCACCGGLACVNGRCRTQTTCGNVDGTCCPTGRCQGGQCVPAYATLADCGGKCNLSIRPAQVTVCGKSVACPSCDACPSLGCPNEVNGFDTSGGCDPQGTCQYCWNGAFGGRCDGARCPRAGDVCSITTGSCFTPCVGP